MNDKGFDRIEAKRTTNKDSETNGWQEIADQAPGYRSEQAMRKPSSEELHPQKEDKKDEQYKERIKKIGALVSKAEHQPNAEHQKEISITKLLEDAAEAAETGELDFTVKTPNIYSSQQEMARFYIGPLSYLEQTEKSGKFQHVGENQYTKKDAAFVKKQRQWNAKKDQESDENEALRVAGKMFEGFFYPLVRQGFFDSPDGKKAAFIATSECDDDNNNKVDAAVAIPITIKNPDGKITPTYALVCFGLTTGSGDGKNKKIEQKFIQGHGLTNLDYPETCLGRPLAPMTDIPHFALCLPRQQELGKFMRSLAAQKPLSRDMQDLINYQILVQASHWRDYWGKQKDQSPDASEKAALFAGLYEYFGKRLISGHENSTFVYDIPKNHSRAVKYLTETMLNKNWPG